MNTAVKVALRVRPLTLQEQINNCAECIAYVPNEPQIGIVGSDKSFTFDYVFDEESNQQHVFEQCAKELVEKFVAGFNVTILAYGQTGSGKTYSMGTGLQYKNDADPAIVPRSANLIFDLLSEQATKDPTFEARIYVSFLELYNEELIDLLNSEPKNKREQITVREDGLGGISWHGVKEHEVKSPQELMDWLQRGSYGRTTASTDMNQASSRSHAIFSVALRQQHAEECEQPEQEDGDQTAVATRSSTERPLKKLHSKFHFVDLAGSERLKRTRAVGDRAKEGISINSGLLALGNVISALGDESRRASHVPYRDSKLTRLLQDSLGGNSATLMLACVSAADVDANETLSTLVYANRARNIRNRVVINQDFRDSASAEVAQLRAEINRLKMENSSFRAMGAGAASQMDQRRAAEEIRALRGEVGRLRDRLKESSAELCDVLAERDTLLVEREVTGDADIEAHPIMTTYHRTVMLLKDRLIAAEDQALELQNLLTQQQASVFGRRAGQAPQPLRRHESFDEDHDADSEHDEDQGAMSPRGRRSPSKRKGQKSARAASKFDFGSTPSLLKGVEPTKLPNTPSMPDITQTLAPGGASAWFQNLKSEENDPLAHLSRDGSYSSSGSSLKQQPRLPTTTATDSDSSYSFSRKSRGSRHGSGGMGDTLDKAKEDIRRGLLLLKAEKSGMDLNMINFLDPASSAILQAGSARGSGSGGAYRRDSILSSSSGMSHRSHRSHPSSHRSRGSQYPGLDDIVAAAISPIQEDFPMESPSGSSWKENSVDDEKVFQEAEQKATETLANAMKAMHQFTFPISQSDIEEHPLVIKPVSGGGTLTPKDILDIEKDAEMHLENARKAMESIAAITSDHRSIRSGDTRSIKSGGDDTAGSTSLGKDSGEPSIASSGHGSRKDGSLEIMLAEGIAIKSALVQQLERAEMEFHSMKRQYEDEIRELELRIFEVEQERDRAMHAREDPNTDKVSALKVKYESKIRQLTSELSELQHKYSEVSKVANEKRNLAENQLRTLKLAVETLKAEKQRMIKRMKEDAERIKEINAANDRELQVLRRSERAAVEGRKKAEREVEHQVMQQQRAQALLHKQSQGGNSAARTVINFLKKAQTPKGISKAPKKAPRLGTSPEPYHEVRSSGYGATAPTSRIPGRSKNTRPGMGPSSSSPPSAQGPSKLRAIQKKQVIDRAIYGYITGRHTIAVMDDLMQKRERLRSEKTELEQERERVVKAQEDEALANGDIVLDFASEPQYMDDRMAMIDAEMAYFTARIRALQAEAVALGMVSAPGSVNAAGGHRSDDEELMTQLQLIRKGMNEDAMGLPPGSGAANAFDSSIKILRSMELAETRDFLEMLFEDMVGVRTHENALSVQVSHQDKVIEELKRALQAMRRTAIGTTESYERRCDGLVAKLRELGFHASAAQQADSCSSSSSRNSLASQSADSGDDGPLVPAGLATLSSDEDDLEGKKRSDGEIDAHALGISMRSASAAHLPSPTSPTNNHDGHGSRGPSPGTSSSWRPLPPAAKPRPGSMAEIVLDEKLSSKRVSTIFDQLYDDAIRTSETASPKVGGSSGEFSRLLMANGDQRRVSFSGIPRAGSTDLTGWANVDKEGDDLQRRLTRSSSTSAIGQNGPRRVSSSDHIPMSKSPSHHGHHNNHHAPPTPRSRPSSMYGHHRSDSTNANGHSNNQQHHQQTLHHTRSLSSMGHHQDGHGSGHVPTHNRSHSSYQQPTASSRRKTTEQQQAEANNQHAAVAARRNGGASTPIAIPAKSTARSRNSGTGSHGYGNSLEHQGASGGDGPVHPLYQQRGRASALSIHTGLPPTPDPTLRHTKSHGAMMMSGGSGGGHQRNAAGGSGGAAVGSRPTTPSPGMNGRRNFFRSDSDTAVSNHHGPPTPGGSSNRNGNGRPLSRIGAASILATTPTASQMVHGSTAADMSFGFHNGTNGCGVDPHHHQHFHMAASRRVSGSWDDNQNVFERLASVHTQASQARVMATTRTGSYPQPYPPSPAGGHAGGSMTTSGNMSSAGFQQLLQQQQQLAEGTSGGSGGNGGSGSVSGTSYPPNRRLSHQPSFERQKLMQQLSQQQQRGQLPSRPASTVPPDHLTSVNLNHHNNTNNNNGGNDTGDNTPDWPSSASSSSAVSLVSTLSILSGTTPEQPLRPATVTAVAAGSSQSRAEDMVSAY
ncbi:Kinesin-like protein kif21b [Actinomortierella ambigua]|nr:Kinesin-like protein kif21b [Actinomortierella ambigua]